MIFLYVSVMDLFKYFLNVFIVVGTFFYKFVVESDVF